MASSILMKGKVVVEEHNTVILSETTTVFHLKISSLMAPTDSKEIGSVDEKNAKYEAVLKSRSNVDGFTSKSSQTRNNPQKNKNDNTTATATGDFGSQANAFEIKDATAHMSSQTDSDIAGVAVELAGDTGENSSNAAGLPPAVLKYVADTVGIALVTPGCLLDTTAAIKPLGPAEIAANKASKDAKSKFPLGRSTAAAGSSTKPTGAVAAQQSVASTNNVASGNRSSDDGTNVPTAPAGNGGGSKKKKDSASQNSGDDMSDPEGDAPMVTGSKANMSTNDASGSNFGEHAGDNAAERFTAEDSLQIVREAEIRKILSSPLLMKRLQLIERAMQQNSNHRAQLEYRDLPDISPLDLFTSDERAKAVDSVDMLFGGGGGGMFGVSGKIPGGVGGFESNNGMNSSGYKGSGSGKNAANKAADIGTGPAPGEKIRRLFTYSNASLVQGREVTSMVWNNVNTDLLAVGYGKTDVFIDTYKPGEPVDEAKAGGLVLFWSLRNPDYPEKILRTPHPVTALDFSKLNPMTLAVGFLNGDVNVYDVKREGIHWGTPFESSSGMAGAHMDPVW